MVGCEIEKWGDYKILIWESYKSEIFKLLKLQNFTILMITYIKNLTFTPSILYKVKKL